jgi:hypothetical protein
MALVDQQAILGFLLLIISIVQSQELANLLGPVPNYSPGGPTSEEGYVKTPQGLFHITCVHELPNGALVREIAASSVTLTAGGNTRALEIEYSDGRKEVRPGCQYPSYMTSKTKRALSPTRNLTDDSNSAQSSEICTWNGWPSHTWFGKDWVPLPGLVESLNASWTTPSYPISTTGPPNSPWPEETLSTWLGVQGGAVLQPVVSFNGVIRGGLAGVSWNCCPAGAVFHSQIVKIQPGTIIHGSVVRENQQVFSIITETPLGNSILRADMSTVAGWKADWALFIIEQYYVASCPQSFSNVLFQNIALRLSNGYTYYNCQASWKPSFETECSGNMQPQCGGTAKCGSNGLQISYNT